MGIARFDVCAHSCPWGYLVCRPLASTPHRREIFPFLPRRDRVHGLAAPFDRTVWPHRLARWRSQLTGLPSRPAADRLWPKIDSVLALSAVDTGDSDTRS